MKLRESPATDVAISQTAEILYRQALAFVRAKANANPEQRCTLVHFKGLDEISLMFDGSRVGSGYTTPQALGSTAIVLGVGQERTTAIAALKALESEAGETAFRHECQHVIDLARHKKKIAKSYDSDKVGNGSASSQDLHQYYNNPMEYNAYFHNIAEPLLRILRLAEEHGIDDAKATGQKIDADFMRYYQQMVWNMRPELSAVVSKMDPSYRKKMLKRLYVLHQAAVEIVGGDENDGRTLVVKVLARVRRLLKALKAI